MFIIFIMWNDIKISHNIATREEIAYPISFHFHLKSLTKSIYNILEAQLWYALAVNYCYYKIMLCKILLTLLITDRKIHKTM